MTTSTNTRPASATPAPRGSSHGRTVVVTVVGVIIGAGLATGLVLGLGGGSDAAPIGAATVPSASASTGGGTSSDAHHHVAPTPPAPSKAIETLQRQLAQLNYYEGPITGTMTPQTVQAITYLQRDAHLPQTGTMTGPTMTALANFLAHGNNQMNS